MIHYCHLKENNFLSSAEVILMVPHPPFRTFFQPVPHHSGVEGGVEVSTSSCNVTFSKLFGTAVKSLAVQRILMRDACLDDFTFQCVASLNDVISISFWFHFVEMKPVYQCTNFY